MFAIKKDEGFDPELVRPEGARQALFNALYKMEVGEYFVVPKSVFAPVSVRARVSEAKRVWKDHRRFECHGEPNGTRVLRIT